MAHHPAEVDDIGCQDEPTDAEPRAQGHEAIFALRGKVLRLRECSAMSPDRVGFALPTGSSEPKNQRKRLLRTWPEFADHRFAARSDEMA
jgi:hypothetical protein